ncbi:MAG: hypothetical protein PVH83_07330, partial [Methyloceanibacter sp.]
AAAPAEGEAASENADDPAEAAEDAAPAEEPAAEEPAAEEPAAEEPAAAATEAPSATNGEASGEAPIVNPPTVAEDAPSLPHKGEPPSPNQPQPVVPADPASTTTRADEASAAGSSDGQSSWPQPVYPDGKPDGVE